MASISQPKVRVGLPAHWRQVSFICFDLGVINVIGGVGAGYFYSQPLFALGFGRSSVSLGVLLILMGLAAYQSRRLPSIVPIVIIVADILNTVYFLPKFELAGGVVLVKISFLVPVFLLLISMLRVGLKLRSPKPEENRRAATLGAGKEVFALLSSIFVSVGAGIVALLLFAHYAMPVITEATNPLINIFHDLFLVPALLFLFPLGAAAGELLWLLASRFYLSGNQLALFVRYLRQVPLISRLTAKLTEQDPVWSRKDPDHFAFDEDVIPYNPSSPRRSWRKYALVTSVIVISFASVLILIRGLSVPEVRGSGAPEEMSAPAGTLVVSQTRRAQYSSISAAVAAASPGATILVRAGTYHEAVVIDKDITLMGDKGATIECAENGCLRITAAKANIRNLTINAEVGFLSRILHYRERTAAVMILSGRSVIEDCDVTSNNGAGILVSGSASAPEIKGVQAHDCFLNGILFTNQSTGLVENSSTHKNRWAGIRADHGSSPIIRRSRIHWGAMAGILIDLAATATVEECEIFENKFSGVHARGGSSVYLRKTRTLRNGINGISIHERSFGRAEACDVSENKNAGIEVSDESGSQIIDTKVHHEKTAGIAVWRNSTTEIEGATIYENGIGLLVATGGKPVIRKSVFRSHTYSAIEVKQGGDPLIEQTQIYGGKSSGIYFRDGAKGVVNECAVFGNAISNIVITSGSDPKIQKTSSSESGYAGVLVMDGGLGSITDCEIFNNYLGVEIRTDSTLSVTDCTIKSNRHQGLVIDGTSEGSVTGSNLAGNTDGAWKISEGAQIMRERNTE